MVLNAHKTIYISESVRNFQSLLKLGIWKSRPKTIWTVASQSNYSHDLLIYTVFSNWISKTSVNNWYQSVPAQKTGDARDQDLHECCTASYFSDSFVPLSACMCFDCSDYKLSTAGTVCYQIYTHKWAKWCLSEWVFQGHHRSVFQAAQFESFRGLLESLYLSISYPMRIQLPLQKLVCCPLSVNTVRSQSWLSLTKEVQEILPLLFNWHHWCFNKVISWMQQNIHPSLLIFIWMCLPPLLQR